MLADKENSLGGIGGKDALGDPDSAQCRKADIEQHQIRPERSRLLNGFRTVRSFTNDLPFVSGLQHTSNVVSPRFEIVDNQDAVSHDHGFSRGLFKQLQTAYASATQNYFVGNVTVDRPNSRLSFGVLPSHRKK